MAARADFAGVFLVLPAGLNLAMNLYCTARRERYRTATVREPVPWRIR